jgi:hypothetical protein
MLQFFFNRTAALSYLFGFTFAGLASWLCIANEVTLHYAFLFAALLVGAFLGFWRGRRISNPFLSVSAGIYVWWLAADSLFVGAVGIGRTVPIGVASRTECGVVFWLVVSFYGVLGLFMLASAASEHRASRRSFRW